VQRLDLARHVTHPPPEALHDRFSDRGLHVVDGVGVGLGAVAAGGHSLHGAGGHGGPLEKVGPVPPAPVVALVARAPLPSRRRTCSQSHISTPAAARTRSVRQLRLLRVLLFQRLLVLFVLNAFLRARLRLNLYRGGLFRRDGRRRVEHVASKCVA